MGAKIEFILVVIVG